MCDAERWLPPCVYVRFADEYNEGIVGVKWRSRQCVPTYVYIYSSSVRNARENSWKAPLPPYIVCIGICTRIGIYDGGGGESDTHTLVWRETSVFLCPPPPEVHPFSQRAVSPTWGSTHKHTAAPSRTLNIMSARGISFLCLPTYAHTHMRFRNLLRSLCTCTHTHNALALHSPADSSLPTPSHTYTHILYNMCMCVRSLSHLFVWMNAAAAADYHDTCIIHNIILWMKLTIIVVFSECSRKTLLCYLYTIRA